MTVLREEFLMLKADNTEVKKNVPFFNEGGFH